MNIERPYNSADPVHRQMMFQSIRLLPPCWYDVTFTAKARPTQAQRGYHHGVVIPIVAAMLTETQGTPFGDDTTHEWAKTTLRPLVTHHPLTGALIVVGRSTKNMPPLEYFAYTDQLIDIATRTGWDVPPPDPRYRELRDRTLRGNENQLKRAG